MWPISFRTIDNYANMYFWCPLKCSIFRKNIIKTNTKLIDDIFHLNFFFFLYVDTAKVLSKPYLKTYKCSPGVVLTDFQFSSTIRTWDYACYFHSRTTFYLEIMTELMELLVLMNEYIYYLLVDTSVVTSL